MKRRATRGGSRGDGKTRRRREKAGGAVKEKRGQSEKGWGGQRGAWIEQLGQPSRKSILKESRSMA
jgi:hypothetical protein